MKSNKYPIARRVPLQGLYLLLPIILFMTVLAGCRKAEPPKPKPLPRIEKLSAAPVDVTITADPANIHLDHDMLLTIKTSAPVFMDVRLPTIQDRLTGFTLSGAFDREPVEKNGYRICEHCFRLTPELADEYRLGIMAITTIDKSQQPPVEDWFTTRPICFQLTSLIEDKPRPDIKSIIGPVWIYPSIQRIALWILVIILLILIGIIIWWIVRRIRRTIRLHKMSPKERALYELNELIAKDLIAKNRVKDFYLELTMVVRRYIERAHAIRAPKQTTEEFLAAVTENPRFSHIVAVKLQDFLQKADLVKFAALHPDKPTINKALATARDYVETDEQESIHV